MDTEIIIVSCRNKHGSDLGKTFCVDFGKDMDTRFIGSNGTKLSYNNTTLKIGRCSLKILSHNIFGGSWCAEIFQLIKTEFTKLIKYLFNSKYWSFEYLDEKHEKLLMK